MKRLLKVAPLLCPLACIQADELVFQTGSNRQLTPPGRCLVRAVGPAVLGLWRTLSPSPAPRPSFSAVLPLDSPRSPLRFPDNPSTTIPTSSLTSA